MKYYNYFFIFSLFLLCCGCEQQNPQLMEISFPTNSENRFVISREAIFNDELAYYGKRGVYIIKDNKTKKEYLGISGVGISELGEHGSGKTHSSDER